MQLPNKNEIKNLKNYYPVGCKIVLDYMDDQQAPPTGTIGEVTCIDDAGTIHVRWENGSGLGLIPGTDQFHKIQ
ncbi:MAG: DUF4314 domain-containing protein [Methanobrevibacter sp.]|nr:DUF4314 domain-containing protein [Methanosphaera sp.]MBR0369235.1 DUF4314 domain-containing protein [Methanobrevibacter sp.]